jgi:hypothetical protein
MSSLYKWTLRQLQKLALFPNYLRALGKEWVNILFGEGLVAIAFLLWWALVGPSNTKLVVVFVVAMLVAGYYAWWADYLRLQPKFKVDKFRVQPTETEDRDTTKMYVRSGFA